jgi:biopolymer transport protein ExbD
MAGGASMSRGGRRGAIVGINVTPMVDVVLVLLVIMMVSATYIVSQSLKVELPKSQSSDEAVPTVSQVTITKDGTYAFNQKPVNEGQLIEQLRASKAANPEVNLVITADAAAQHGMVVHVIDLSKQEGIAKFAINIQRE